MNPKHEEEILGAVRQAAEPIRLSDAARDRIAHRLRGGAAGATTLREAGRRWPVRGALLAAASAAVLMAVWLVPAIDRETTVSAAEVLGRSQQALAAPMSGVEVLTYDLTLGGVLRDLLPAGQAGRFTVEETVDHDQPGRYKLLKLAEDGRIAAGVADDTLAHTRARYIRLENRGFLLRISDTPASALSVVALKRAAVQALIAMMQASDRQSLREVERGGEPAYEVDVPGSAATDNGLITLQRAAVLVHRTDARLLDFDAEGTIGGQPFAITFNLRSRESRPAGAATPVVFAIDPEPGDEVINAGGASGAPLWDIIRECLQK